jgi:hypothetical protein
MVGFFIVRCLHTLPCTLHAPFPKPPNNHRLTTPHPPARSLTTRSATSPPPAAPPPSPPSRPSPMSARAWCSSTSGWTASRQKSGRWAHGRVCGVMCTLHVRPTNTATNNRNRNQPQPQRQPPPRQAAYLIESVWLVLVLSALLLIARAAFVIPFSVVHNLMPHAEKLSRRDVVIIWWSGLMRGAVSVALVYLHFDRNDKVGGWGLLFLGLWTAEAL